MNKLNQLKREIKSLREKIDAEFARFDDRDMPADVVKQVDTWNDELSQKIDEYKRAEAQKKSGDEVRAIFRNGTKAPEASTGPFLTKGQKLADRYRTEQPLSLGKYVKGIVTGDWEGAYEEKAMSVGSLTAGGYLVPAPLAAGVIDNARNVARVLEAGATVVPMDTNTLRIATVEEDPTPAWHTENAADVVVDDAVIGAREFKAQTLPVIVKISRELFEDGQNVDQAIRQAIAQALALELDRVALYGTGTDPEPQGLYNTSGLSVVTMGANGAAITSYAQIIEAIGNVWANNHDPNAGILAPRTKTAIAGFLDSTGQPMRVPPVVDNLDWYATNQVSITQTQGTATNASDVFVGDWSKLLIGIRTGFTIELLRERYVDNFQYAFLAHLRADVQVADIGAFSVVQGIVPA